MIKLDENKLAKLRTSSERLTEKYGELGSPEREEFEARAKAYYYAELLKEQRKQHKKREYISNIERGNSDMQLSTFMQIANALGLRFALVVG